jgi:hypothetical protein
MTATALALCEPPPADEIDGVIEDAILRFLSGETEGRELFEALYGEAVDEPVPERMLALIRSAARD